MDPALQDQED
jgi:hypothetical protein